MGTHLFDGCVKRASIPDCIVRCQALEGLLSQRSGQSLRKTAVPISQTRATLRCNHSEIITLVPSGKVAE